MTAITVKNLCKSFVRQDGVALEVLVDVSFSAAKNEFCCLLGVSGCGKSTILNILSGLVPFDSGDVLIDDSLLTDSQTRIGYVFQKSRLLNWRTVRENVFFALKNMNFPRDEWDARAEHYIKLVGLGDFIEEYPLSLSGGMQQRVAIARALAIDPDILLMDEPFSHLDELTAREMRIELLQIWAEEKKTVIFVTHNALEAAFLADKIYVLGKPPSRVQKCLTVDVPRVREFEDPRLVKIQKEVISLLGLSTASGGSKVS